jgi:multimeric flavodoxin WrbA
LRGLREFLLICVACASASVCASAQTLERVFIKGSRLTYGDYVVTRTIAEQEGESRAVITRGGRELVRVADGAPRVDATRIGLFPFLGGKGGRQLVVEQYTGGAHCCTIYRVYDLGAQLRVLFDGDEYGIEEVGEDMRLVDIDGDGRYEFAQSVMAFDYFLTSHAGSVFPTAVFAYDEGAGKYVPSNRKFSAYLLRGIARDVAKVEALNRRLTREESANAFHGEHFSAVMDVLLKYVYAGEEGKGWAFFETHYKLADRSEVEAKVKEHLKESNIYRATYGLVLEKRPEAARASEAEVFKGTVGGRVWR